MTRSQRRLAAHDERCSVLNCMYLSCISTINSNRYTTRRARHIVVGPRDIPRLLLRRTAYGTESATNGRPRGGPSVRKRAPFQTAVRDTPQTDKAGTLHDLNAFGTRGTMRGIAVPRVAGDMKELKSYLITRICRALDLSSSPLSASAPCWGWAQARSTRTSQRAR